MRLITKNRADRTFGDTAEIVSPSRAGRVDAISTVVQRSGRAHRADRIRAQDEMTLLMQSTAMTRTKGRKEGSSERYH
jgi:hypothetical protein